MGELLRNPEAAAAARRYIRDRLADGAFAPKVAKTFPLEWIVDAYRFVLTNDQMGTVIMECSR